MKKNNIISLLLILLLMGSCMDESPKYLHDRDKVFDTSSTASSALMEIYGNLAAINLYGRHVWFYAVANGTTIGTYSNRFTNYDSDPNDGAFAATWKQLYTVIEGANSAIAGMESSSLDEKQKNTIVAHARFLRGYAYYALATLWGRAPLYLEPVTSNKLHRPLSPRKELYAQAESDLIFASQNLPKEKNIYERADQGAAKAFLAKLYFMQASQKQSGIDDGTDLSANELWEKTRTLAKELVDSGKYALEPNFATLFSSHLSKSKESIFQLNYSSTAGVQKRWNQLFGPPDYVKVSPSFRNIRMDKAFYDFHIGTHPTDSRIATTYINNYQNSKGAQQYAYPFESKKVNGQVEVYNLRDYKLPNSDPKNPQYDFESASMPEALKELWKNKNNGAIGNKHYPFNGKAADKGSVAQFDSRNTILFRYSDLLLILADAENELGNTAEAANYLNMVLNRANIPNAPTMNQEQMRDYIFFERMFEFAGEPFLFEDVRRRGTSYLKKVIEIHNNSWIVNYRVNFAEKEHLIANFGEMLINGGDLNEDFLRRNLLLPIPQQEINYNENISQQDQNFGY